MSAIEHHQYVADSSYWVYLSHFPLTVLVGAMLYGSDWIPWLKMGLNITVTTAACLASYQLMVRHTWIGVLLNGRRGGSQVRQRVIGGKNSASSVAGGA